MRAGTSVASGLERGTAQQQVGVEICEGGKRAHENVVGPVRAHRRVAVAARCLLQRADDRVLQDQPEAEAE